MSQSARAQVVDTGGGEVRLLIDRDAPAYPAAGAEVMLAWEEGPSREERVAVALCAAYAHCSAKPCQPCQDDTLLMLRMLDAVRAQWRERDVF